MSTFREKQRHMVEWEDPLPHIQQALGWSGLETMQAYITGQLPPPPIASLMNLRILEVEEGRAIVSTTPGPQHFNTLMTIHGGFLATVLDSALGCAVHSTLPRGMLYSTAQLSIQYTRPVLPETGELLCEGAVLHRGQKMLTAEAYLRDNEGRLYAHATASCLTFPIRN